MYWIPKNSQGKIEETTSPNNCFHAKVRNWLWLLGITVIAAVVLAFASTLEQQPVYSSTFQQLLPQDGQFQNIALSRCPYCTGLLDSRGRCNIRKCPIYSPNWGKTTTARGVPVKQVLIEELAMEVSASEGKMSVIVHDVYGSGNADKAGLQAGDRICRFNGRKVKNIKQFNTAVARARPESYIKIQVLRGTEKIKTDVMIGEGEMEGVTIPR